MPAGARAWSWSGGRAVVCGLLGAGVVVACSLEGMVAGSPDPPLRTERRPVVPQGLSTRRGGAAEADRSRVPGHVSWVLIALVALVALALLVAAMVWWRRSRRVRGAAGGDTDLVVLASPEPDASVVRRGIAGASAALRLGHRTPGDALVQAWLELERAAADAGVVRTPAETPTEFTARLLVRVDADRVAAQVLLELYLRARFGAGSVTAEDTARAAGALDALTRTWTVAAGPGRRPAGVR